MKNALMRSGLLTLALGAPIAASALPTSVSVTPPSGGRFLSGQKFDLRVEGKGTGPFSATLALDGAPLTFTSGAQNTTTTDGISSAGYGGFNLRGFSINATGTHTLTATFTDSTGTVTKSAQIQVFNMSGNRAPVKNIIIMLGDGMGVQHTTAARIVRYGVTAGHPNDFLALQKFPGTGLVTTHSLNSIVTDSAPGMACYVSGNHTQNSQEGVFPANVTNPFYAPRIEYIAEYLHRTKGKALGIVSTADIEDATPAANAIHTANRNAGQGVCDQYLDESGNTGLTVLMGGGRRWFLPSGQFGSSRSASNDYAGLPADLQTAWSAPAGSVDGSRNLLGDFQAAGFAYASSLTDMNTIFAGGTPNKLLGLFGYGNMNVTMDKIAKRRGTLLPGATTFAVDDYHASDQPMLDEMTDAALRVLGKNPNGFVAMIEGAHIDKQSHYMDADRAILETLEFDRACKVAQNYADTLGNTIVIVTADHECSGFSLIGALTAVSTTGGNTANTAGSIASLQNLPSDATGNFAPGTTPTRQNSVGEYDSAAFPTYNILADGYPATMDIDGKLLVGFGANADRYEGWLSKPQPVIDNPLIPNDIAAELAGKGYPTSGVPFARQAKTTAPYGDSNGFFVRGQVNGTQAIHTASEIPIYAYSSGSRAYQQFYGDYENTDVFFKLMAAALGGY